MVQIKTHLGKAKEMHENNNQIQDDCYEGGEGLGKEMQGYQYTENNF